MRTIIIDFDGTIADTHMAIFATVQSTLQSLKLTVPDEQAVRQVIGMPLHDTFTKAASITDESLIQEYISCYRSRFNEICKDYIQLYPGVKETLKALKEAEIQRTNHTPSSQASMKEIINHADFIRSKFLSIRYLRHNLGIAPCG